MRKILAGIVVGLFVLSAVGIVNAAIADMDDVGGVGYFKDVETGKVWMDVDHFFDMTPDEMTLYLQGSNFHLASVDEMDGLIASVGADFNFDIVWGIMGGGSYSNGNRIISGIDSRTEIPTTGVLHYGTRIIFEDTTTNWGYGGMAHNNSSPTIGAWAVSNNSSVPIPGAIWLLGTGLLGLVGCSRKINE